MTSLKIVALVSGIILLAFVGGLFGPGPLIPGLATGLGTSSQHQCHSFLSHTQPSRSDHTRVRTDFDTAQARTTFRYIDRGQHAPRSEAVCPLQ
jgi:hypothetical protein